MSYRGQLLTRWSRRDRLAILVVAVTVAFLTGTVLVGMAVGSSTTSIAAEYDAAATFQWASGDAPSDDATVVLPVAVVTANGTETLAVGVPPTATVAGTPLPDAGTWGVHNTSRRLTLAGTNGTATVTVKPRDASPFPDRWVTVTPTTVAQLGRDATILASPASGVPRDGVPFQGVLAFFIAGTREVLAALAVAGVIGATLAGVTVFATTRMTVRDRAATVAILRTTGATPWSVTSLFVGRALLQVLVGVALGYATGVVLTNVVVQTAVASGVPTSLDVAVTSRAAGVLLGLYAIVVAVAAAGALAAVRPVVTRPPARVTREPARASLPGPLAPRLLDARAVVPTAATLAAFVAFLLLVAGVGAVAAPLAATDDTTVTAPDATHPINSNVPAAYARVLRDRGIPASAEILLFEVRNGQPFPARGANYSAFATLTGADLEHGRRPARADEAVIGAGLARTLNVDVGDRVLLGGSTRRAIASVRIVGMFTAPGSTDDQLIVPLDTARHLSSTDRGHAQFIRAARLPDPGTHDTIDVAAVAAPATVAAGDRFRVRLTLRNAGLVPETTTVTVRFAGQTQRIEARVPAAGKRHISIRLRAPNRSGRETLLVSGNLSSDIRVLPPNSLRVVDLPGRAPPGSEPRIRVVDANGHAVANATVAAQSHSARTDQTGYARLNLRDPGETVVTAKRGGRTATATVTVSQNATRSLRVALSLSPRQPTMYTRPELAVQLTNPWNRTLTRTLRVDAPGGPYLSRVTLAPGAMRRLRWTLPRQPPGNTTVAASVGGVRRATTAYRTTGDERVVAALATGGRAGTTGIGRAAATAFGNLGLALAVLVLLGGLMAVGGTAATFAAAVHARRRTLGVNRAVGAPPTWVVRTVVTDAVRLGTVAIAPAVLAGVGVLALVDAAGLLVVYGVRVPVVPSTDILVGAAAGALLVTVAGAGVAAVSIAEIAPARLLDGDRVPEEVAVDE